MMQSRYPQECETQDAKEEPYEVARQQRNRSGSSKSRERGHKLTAWRKRVKQARRAGRVS